MQKYCTELTDRLLKSLDKEYNVVDMGAVVDVITALEKTTITKEVLEITRLGKYINELRRKTTNDALAKRAKDLVRKWREMVLPSSHPTTISHQPPPPSSISHDTTSYQTINGITKPLSPTIRNVKPRSPIATRIIKPQSPLLRDVITSMKVLSPALSLNSDHSRSPSLTPMKQLPTSMVITNSRVNSTLSPLLSGTNQNHSIEAVPRTHSSNKRLRKDENASQLSSLQPQQQQQQCDMGSTLRDESTIAKKPRINGDNVNISINSQVPSSPSLTCKDKNSMELINHTEVDTGPKKRGRKKGSKSLKNQPLPEDRVKEKLASIARNPKLKTTQELLADLQARGSNVVGNAGIVGTVGQSIVNRRTITEPPTTEEILRSTTNADNHGVSDDIGSGGGVTVDKVNRMKITQSNSSKRRGESRVPDMEIINTPSNVPPANSTVEEILAKLPPLDLDSIRWSDDDDNESATMNGDDLIDKNTDDIVCRRRQITEHDVDRLHENCIEGLNGNYQLKDISADRKENEMEKGLTELCDITTTETVKKIRDVYKRRITDDGTDREFREWHEMLARPSYDGQTLHILPYVIID
ncbi:hypothetical protein PV327_001933 [Microctonus hyperodae]|uniref:Mediator of RNA polymerase II transcription subunit 26 n=1 Tax=Microctonus hyperodae TaxID=165561 RepID=A0AA39KNM9_MICHY|nr:hypothetical protein PV327_001933 [Microctonus hyperodae]